MSKKILIVEDDFYIRDLYERALKKSGYDVSLASDGQEAIEITKTNTFDLILLDILLPKVTGIDVLRVLRDPVSTAKDTPIFLITNLGQEDIIKQAFKIGADGYLLKARLSPENIADEIASFFSQNEAVKDNKKPSE